jgi:hypothetical protein
MSTDEERTKVAVKQHIDQFDEVDILTFGIFLAAFVIWFLANPFVSGFLWSSAVPAVLVAFAASRRWSALLTIGPASAVEE